MKRGLSGVLAAAALMFSSLAAANRGDVDVVTGFAGDLGTAKKRRQPPPAQPCNRCCVYQNQNYS